MIGINDPARIGLNDQHDRGVFFKQYPESVFTLFEGLFLLFLIGDVNHDTDIPDYFTIGITKWTSFRHKPSFSSLSITYTPGTIVFTAFFYGFTDGLFNFIPVFRDNGVSPVFKGKLTAIRFESAEMPYFI